MSSDGQLSASEALQRGQSQSTDHSEKENGKTTVGGSGSRWDTPPKNSGSSDGGSVAGGDDKKRRAGVAGQKGVSSEAIIGTKQAEIPGPIQTVPPLMFRKRSHNIKDFGKSPQSTFRALKNVKSGMSREFAPVGDQAEDSPDGGRKPREHEAAMSHGKGYSVRSHLQPAKSATILSPQLLETYGEAYGVFGHTRAKSLSLYDKHVGSPQTDDDNTSWPSSSRSSFTYKQRSGDAARVTQAHSDQFCSAVGSRRHSDRTEFNDAISIVESEEIAKSLWSLRAHHTSDMDWKVDQRAYVHANILGGPSQRYSRIVRIFSHESSKATPVYSVGNLGAVSRQHPPDVVTKEVGADFQSFVREQRKLYGQASLEKLSFECDKADSAVVLKCLAENGEEADAVEKTKKLLRSVSSDLAHDIMKPILGCINVISATFSWARTNFTTADERNMSGKSDSEGSLNGKNASNGVVSNGSQNGISNGSNGDTDNNWRSWLHVLELGAVQNASDDSSNNSNTFVSDTETTSGVKLIRTHGSLPSKSGGANQRGDASVKRDGAAAAPNYGGGHVSVAVNQDSNYSLRSTTASTVPISSFAISDTPTANATAKSPLLSSDKPSLLFLATAKVKSAVSFVGGTFVAMCRALSHAVMWMFIQIRRILYIILLCFYLPAQALFSWLHKKYFAARQTKKWEHRATHSESHVLIVSLI